MATRMQQRRGTAAQWSGANPILAPGEIGFESDTGQFKIGDGINHWEDLSYFKNMEDLGGSLDDYVPLSTKGQAGGVAELDVNGQVPTSQLGNIIDGAPLLLDTLNELSAAINDDQNFATTISTSLSAKASLSGTETLTNKTISGSSNNITNISNNSLDNSSVTINGLVFTLGESHPMGSDAIPEGSTNLFHTTPRVHTVIEQVSGDGLDYDSNNNKLNLSVDGNSGLLIDANHKLAIDSDVVTLNTAEQTLSGKSLTLPKINSAVELTATSAELNILDGATLSTTELNHLDGVTSPIQEQLDAKASSTNLNDHTSDTTSVHGISDTANLVYTADLQNHSGDTTNVHGITDTAELATKEFAANLLTGATLSNITITGNKDGLTITAENGVGDSTTDNLTEGTTNKYFTNARAVQAISSHVGTGLSFNTSTDQIEVAANTYDAYGAASTVASDLSAHASDTTDIHGIADTSALATKTYADNAVSTHEADTTNVHGIANTSLLVTTTGTQTLTNKTITSPSGLVKSDVGLGNVDNTSDANKPVSTATQTALDEKASLSGATFTGAISGTSLTLSGNLTVNGTTETVNSTTVTIADPMIYLGGDNSGNSVDLGFVSSFNDGTYQHSGLVRDASAGTWKLFKGVTDEPTTTVNFAQGSLDDLSVKDLTATNVIVGSTNVITELNTKTPELYTFTTVSETTKTIATADKFKSLKFTSASAVAVTVPTNASDAIPVGSYIELYQWGAGQLTVTAATPATTSIRSTDSQNKSRTQYSSMVLIKVDTDEWLLTGDLTA